MISWEQWRTLLAVSRHGTFMHAARALAVNATTVGRRLKLLEAEIGYELFIRENDRLYPTGRCETLLTFLETAEEALREADQSRAGRDLGKIWRELRVTGPPFLLTHVIAPAVTRYTAQRNVRVELIGTESKAIFSRRDADIAIRISDDPKGFKAGSARTDTERLGTLRYAVYRAKRAIEDDLPWAGLIEGHVQTTGSEVMAGLAGPDGFHYQALHFDTLVEFVAAGAAQAMLPVAVADGDRRLMRSGGIVLEQPLWILSHRQDRGMHHLQAARAWLRDLAVERLGHKT